MHKAIELFAAIYFLVIGLSHLLQPIAWVEFFSSLRAMGRPGAFLEGFLCLTFGTLILSFHNIWSGLPTVLTVVGVLQILKGILRFCAPNLALRIYARMSPDRAWHFRIAGVFSIALGMLFGYIWLSP
jgi:uncharacterized protein YjeT (DUF2065 family)